MSDEFTKPIRVHRQVASQSITGIVSAAVFANLAWAGVTVPAEVIAADTAVLGLIVQLAQRYLPES